MSLIFYKPNKANKGALVNISHTSRADKREEGKATEKGDKSLWIKLVAQTGWDEKEQTGSFKNGKFINVKMSPTEVGGMLWAIEQNVSLATAMGQQYVYHDGKDFATTITFEPAMKKEKKGETWVDTGEQRGFMLSVTKTSKANKDEKETLKVGLTFAELGLLKYYLTDVVYHFCGAWKAEDVAAFSDKEKKAPAKKEAAKEPVKEPEPVKRETPPDDNSWE